MNDLESQLADRTLEFPLGLPGFPGDRRFVLSQAPAERPFAWLTSLDTPGLSFPVVEPRYLVPEYTIEVEDGELAPLALAGTRDTALLAILRIRQEERLEIVANLRAPIVINTATRRGRQVILGDDTRWTDSELFTF